MCVKGYISLGIWRRQRFRDDEYITEQEQISVFDGLIKRVSTLSREKQSKLTCRLTTCLTGKLITSLRGGSSNTSGLASGANAKTAFNLSIISLLGPFGRSFSRTDGRREDGSGRGSLSCRHGDFGRYTVERSSPTSRTVDTVRCSDACRELDIFRADRSCGDADAVPGAASSSARCPPIDTGGAKPLPSVSCPCLSRSRCSFRPV